VPKPGSPNHAKAVFSIDPRVQLILVVLCNALGFTPRCLIAAPSDALGGTWRRTTLGSFGGRKCLHLYKTLHHKAYYPAVVFPAFLTDRTTVISNLFSLSASCATGEVISCRWEVLSPEDVLNTGPKACLPALEKTFRLRWFQPGYVGR